MESVLTDVQAVSGKPGVKITAEAVANLKAQGLSLRQIGCKLGIGVATAHKDAKEGPKGAPTPFINFLEQ